MGFNRPNPPERIVVLGAGLSGLTAAHRLFQRANETGLDLEVVVLEARRRVGGAIWTDREDGFILEGGADSFISNKPEALALCRELGLEDRLIHTDERFRRSFVVKHGRPLPVPEGFVLMAPRKLGPLLSSPILSWRGKLRMLMDLVLPRRLDGADESLAGFVQRRLGQEALERLVQPLVAGIYTADPRELSLEATLPQFARLEREHGGLIRGALKEAKVGRTTERDSSGARYGLFVSLDDGMAVLPRTLADTLPPETIRLNAPARRVCRPTGESRWWVELLDGHRIDASAVVLAVEAHAAARLIGGHDPSLALELRSIPYASSAIVQLGYHREQVGHPLDGFGMVVPSIEGRRILAVSFTSVKFPNRAPEGTVLFRVFLGGALQPEMNDLDDEALIDVAHREVAELLRVRGAPLLSRVARHDRAMPQYTLGHLDRSKAIRAQADRHPGLVLAGNAFEGVGIPDCVRSGQAAADRALEALQDALGKAVA